MQIKVKAFFVVIFFLVSFILTSFPISKTEKVEAESFSVSYDITFKFTKSGAANVVQKITLKNLTADLYASEYSLNIGSSNVKNIKGKDSLGAVIVTSKKNKDTSVLSAKINEKTIGKNKTTNLTLTYTIDDLATKSGGVWEIQVPGISTAEKLANFDLKIKIPNSFGPLYSISPKENSQSKEKGFTTYIFNKKDTPEDTILANFGEYQNVEFAFKYKIINKNFFSKEERILIPPDTSYQEINFTDLTPRPEKIEIDPDGNYLAIYKLEAGEEKEILIKGYALIDKRLSETSEKVENKAENLGSNKFWESDSPQIADKAKELKDIRGIYDFVTQTLVFNEENIDKNINKRHGAKSALANPTDALTSEFVDLFIALARAKGIPARQVVGFAFGDSTNRTPTLVNGNSNSRTLHSWVEYFGQDKNKWIQVDPTWGATRSVDYLAQVDPNHFALFIRSSSSESPQIPSIFANGTSTNNQTKPVNQLFNFSSGPKLEVKMDKTISGFPTIGKVLIKNDTGKSLRMAKLTINTKSVSVIGEKTQELGTILPFSEYTVNIKLRSGSLVSSNEENLEVVLSGFDKGQEKIIKEEKKILIKPFFSFNTPQVLLLLLLLAVLGGLAFPLIKRFKLD